MDRQWFKECEPPLRPRSGSGIWFWPSAAEKCSEFFSRALQQWQSKRHARALFFLGAAVHLVQDLCVPHHASCKVFGGHVDFEDWAGRMKSHYRVDSGGTYDISENPEDWIVENARVAKGYYCQVADHSPVGYHKAAESLLPRAQQTTAGFLMHFYNRLNV